MYRTLFTVGFLLGGGAIAAELTCIVCTALGSYNEYRERNMQYRQAKQHLEDITHQEEIEYRSIFWKNLKRVHTLAFGKP